jgi:hypothetical protein
MILDAQQAKKIWNLKVIGALATARQAYTPTIHLFKLNFSLLSLRGKVKLSLDKAVEVQMVVWRRGSYIF